MNWRAEFTGTPCDEVECGIFTYSVRRGGVQSFTKALCHEWHVWLWS